jgi:hypothetical protein
MKKAPVAMKAKPTRWFQVKGSFKYSTEKTAKTDNGMTSWMVFNSAAEKWPWPIRFAGTIRQYSKKAIPQLTRITVISAVSLNFRCPYQAKVMKMFEARRRPMVTSGVDRFGIGPSGCWIVPA